MFKYLKRGISSIIIVLLGLIIINRGLVSWQFLEKNIVNRLIDIFVLGIIAAFLLDRYLDKKETKELWKKIKPQLEKEIVANRDSAQEFQGFLKKYGGQSGLLIPNTEPFCTPVLFIVFRQRLIRTISAQRLSLMVELFNYCSQANVIIKQLDQTDKEECRELIRPSGYGGDLSKRKGYYIQELENNLLPFIVQACDKLLI